MKRLIPLCLALACAGFMASTLLAAPTDTALPPLSQQQSISQMTSTNYTLDWSTVGEISGGSSASANFKLTGTSGQMAANTSSVSTAYGLCTGFECVLNYLRQFLPVVLR
jgi:hypothetical protein